MDRIGGATLLALLLTLLFSGAVYGAAGAELPDDVLRQLIAAEVDVMTENLSNLTDIINDAVVAPPGPRRTVRPGVLAGRRQVRPTTLNLLLQEGKRSDGVLQIAQAARAGELLAAAAAGGSLRPQTLDTDGGVDPPAVPCDLTQVRTTLVSSAVALDQVTYRVFTQQTLTNLTDLDAKLTSFQTDCTFQFSDKAEKSSLLQMVRAVQNHTGPASSAATADDGDGVPLNSAFMVVLIALSVLMGVLLLSALAVFAYMQAQSSSRQAKPRRRVAAPGAGVSGQVNPAYQADAQRPPPSLHETENWRWTRQSDAQPHSADDEPVTTRAAKKSTWGRIWGGVVRDYQQHSPAAREPEPQPMARQQARPLSAYGAGADVVGSAPARRGVDRPAQQQARYPARDSHDAERAASRPARRDDSPPVHRASPSMENSDNWSYGASGRNKSTDSPFSAPAW